MTQILARTYLLAQASSSVRLLGSQASSKSFETPDKKLFPKFLKNIEAKWKTKLARRFDRERYFGSKEEENKASVRYILSMFPYPSGKLHLGHVRTYTSGDILARYSKLFQKNPKSKANYTHVINPMGFDSFGLPADNAARERGLDPAVWTSTNIRSMKQQLDDLALQFDWREATSNPSFYKWTQDLFLKLHDANLVYKSYSEVNWDPVDKTVLADEQVDDEGCSWRSGAKVEKRLCRQWFVKTNAFVEQIYNSQEIDFDSWKDIVAIQRNWTGKPSGWLFYLPVRLQNSDYDETLLVFTEKPELFLDASSELVIGSNHWLEKVHRISKAGTISNPFTLRPINVKLTENTESLPQNCLATLQSPESCLESPEPRSQVLLQASLHGYGGFYTSSSYRDWLVSRQRVWGTPLPMVECPKCKICPVPRENLPVTLPKTNDMDYDRPIVDPGQHAVSNPLKNFAPSNWLETECTKCNLTVEREGETLDTLFDSSWYFLRYASSSPSDKPFEPERVQPTWCYIGGKEHASMHLFYARFITHFLNSLGELEFKEPFGKLLVQGMVKGKTYLLNGRYLSPSDMSEVEDISQVKVEYMKMSKSKGNGVDPDELLNEYGIDATRFCLMNYANPRSERLWRSNEEEFRDVLIFLRKVSLTVEQYVAVGRDLSGGKLVKLKELNPEELDNASSSLEETRNKCALEALLHLEQTFQIRQFISVLHVIVGALRGSLDSSVIYTEEYAKLLASLIVMINPITPHLSEELWSHFSHSLINPYRNKTNSEYMMDLQASDQPWPLPDDNFPRTIRIRAPNRDDYIDKIVIDQISLGQLTDDELAKYVENHYASRGDKCKIISVQKIQDMTAIVVADVKSFEQQTQSRTEKKTTKKIKIKSKQTRSDE